MLSLFIAMQLLPPANLRLADDVQGHTLLCPDVFGVYHVTAIEYAPNQPLEFGCVPETAPMSWFFDSEPYDCSTLKAQSAATKFWLGDYPFSDGGSITSFRCVDVYDGDDYRSVGDLAQQHRQTIGIIHNDFNQADSSSPPPWWANKGEVMILGVPDANGRPPRMIGGGAGNLLQWQSTSGNLAVINLRGNQGIGVGSSFRHAIKQTITLYGVSRIAGSRLLFTAYEGGGSNLLNPNDPSRPINDEIYIANSAVSGGCPSHNIYLDRNYLQYAYRLISYDSGGSGCAAAVHPLKLDGRLVFCVECLLSNEGIHREIRSSRGGMAPLSAVACQEGVIINSTLRNHTGNEGGGSGAAQMQIRHALVGCDVEAGYKSNTAPAPVYDGLIADPYNGIGMRMTRFWDDPTYWIDPPLLTTYYVDNYVEIKRHSGAVEGAFYPLHHESSFPASSGTFHQGGPDFTFVPPPLEWRERSRVLAVNNCFDGGNTMIARLNAPRFVNCNDPGAPSWAETWPGCANGGHPSDEWPFVLLQNDCESKQAIPIDVQSEIDRLMAIPRPPWQVWATN